jgi:uncharacterized protein (UPF0332 family)
VLPLDLIATARHLLTADNGNPSEADLRRAISTAYYALFHYICRECADRLVGCTAAQRSQRAWRQAYRSVLHKPAKTRCQAIHRDEREKLNFPKDVCAFAARFQTAQEKRHRADYDSGASVTLQDAETEINEAEDVIRKMARVPAKHRKAFAVYLAMPIWDKSGH